MFPIWMAAKNFRSPTITRSIYRLPGVRTVVQFSTRRLRTAVRPYFCLSYTAAKKPSLRRAGAADISAGNSRQTAKSIVATLESGGNTNLYLLDRSGNVIRRLTNDPGIEVSPAWSPDGKQVVFVSDRSGSPQLYILDVCRGQHAPTHVQRKLQHFAGVVAERRSDRLYGARRQSLRDFYDSCGRRRSA